VDQLAEEIGTIQSLKNACDPNLNVILLALDAPPVFMGAKVLRALSQILAIDPNILTNVSVRKNTKMIYITI
jgi:cohesin loading factor subunit SCC2